MTLKFARIVLALAFVAMRVHAGYTHYYIWHKAPDETALMQCVAEMNQLIEARKSILVSPDLPDAVAGSLKLGTNKVDFNGVGDDSHETFVFPYVFEDKSEFNFCKTAYKPYDEVVTACLIVARDHFPPAVLTIKSDGSWNDWSAGASLYTATFHRNSKNPLQEGWDTEVPPRIRVILIICMVLVLPGLIRYSRKWSNR